MSKLIGARALLREEILRGDHRPGTYMPSIRALADRLSISKSTTHTILKMLDEEGLVHLSAGRGAMVCELPPGQKYLRRFFLRPSDYGVFQYLPVAEKLLSGVSHGAEMRNAEMLVSFSDSPGMTESMINAYNRGEIQGILYLQCKDEESLIRPLEEAGIPYVISHDMHGFDAVKCGIDFASLTRRALRFLAERGKRRTALVIGDPDDFIYRKTLSVFLEEAPKLGMEIRPEWLLANVTPDSMEHLAALFASSNSLPDAFFTVRDYRAKLLYELAAKHHLCIPQDFSVLSFDDATWPEAAKNGLTTFAEPLHELGEKAVMLLQQWVQSAHRPSSILCDVPLIERASV